MAVVICLFDPTERLTMRHSTKIIHIPCLSQRGAQGWVATNYLHKYLVFKVPDKVRNTGVARGGPSRPCLLPLAPLPFQGALLAPKIRAIYILTRLKNTKFCTCGAIFFWRWHQSDLEWRPSDDFPFADFWPRHCRGLCSTHRCVPLKPGVYKLGPKHVTNVRLTLVKR